MASYGRSNIVYQHPAVKSMELCLDCAGNVFGILKTCGMRNIALFGVIRAADGVFQHALNDGVLNALFCAYLCAGYQTAVLVNIQQRAYAQHGGYASGSL